jgi:hypothetical protein
MNRKELNVVLKVLEKIKNKDTYVIEAIHNVRRDLVRYDKQAKVNRENNKQGYEIPW